jgi:hypothetical protein
MFKKTYKWIELNVGWFFVNGFKHIGITLTLNYIKSILIVRTNI